MDDEPKLHVDSDRPKVHYYNEYQLEDRIRKAVAEALQEAANRVKSAILDYGIGVNASYYSPMIRRDLAAQLAERAILADKQDPDPYETWSQPYQATVSSARAMHERDPSESAMLMLIDEIQQIWESPK